jgi:hypothetical protein
VSTKSDLVGSAGLFAAAYELARLEWLVSPTFGNAARTDLLVQRTTEPRLTAAIQVKTRTSGDFHLDISDGSPPEANEWVILVSLGNADERPDFCVMPRNHVCTLVRVLGGILKSQGKPWPRKLIGEDAFHDYSEKWELMKAPAGEAPWWLPQWVFDGRHLAEPSLHDLSPPPPPARSPGP